MGSYLACYPQPIVFHTDSYPIVIQHRSTNRNRTRVVGLFVRGGVFFIKKIAGLKVELTIFKFLFFFMGFFFGFKF